ncbi:MAG: hypothetical protein HUU46_03300 [Candidatus Hydrogenedentes bacterium]|nr:hypothetical protein [Candidatus Hydrogenedentota bacterium]
MKLPNVENAVVPERKVVQYLLSSSHARGRHKAAFFGQFGFSVSAWWVLAHAIKRHAREHDVTIVEETSFGIPYTIDGPLAAPDGRRPNVRVGWFVRNG